MKIWVTGGSGFLGNAIVKHLLERGNEVWVGCHRRRPQGLEPYDAQRYRIVPGDLNDEDYVAQCCKSVDAIIHTAAKVEMWGPYSAFHRANVLATETLLKQSQKHQIKYFVYTSTPSVVHSGEDIQGGNESLAYASHFLSSYARSKTFAEQAVLAANQPGMQTVALRPHLIWGPGDTHILPQLLKKARAKKLRLVKADAKVDTVFIDNAALAHLDALDSMQHNSQLGGQAFFVSQDEPVILNEFINRLLLCARLDPVHPQISPRLAKIIGALTEEIYQRLMPGKEMPINRFIVQQMTTSHWFDISAIKQQCGYRPRVSIEQGLSRLHHWLYLRGELGASKI